MRGKTLTYAGCSYLDRTVALENGRVVPEGIDLTFISFPSPGDLFRRQSQFAEFESSEMSLSTLIMLVARNDDRFVGLPIFPSRQFRHKDIFVNNDSGIERPEDLAGRNVGILQYQMTAALWIRAFLTHDHGVSPEKIHWWTGGLRSPGYVPRNEFGAPPDVTVDVIPEDRTLEEMLRTGELDALVTVQPPKPPPGKHSNARRLFQGYRSVERDYYLRTGFFPIMHVVVFRRDVYERDSWMAVNLVEAFTAAKKVGQDRLKHLGQLAISLPWLATEIEEIDELFGGDAFSYGVDGNRPVLEAMVRYSHEQGLSPREVSIEELFAPETMGNRIES